MPSLEPIPVPPHLRWREFRVRFLPGLTTFLLAATAAVIWQQQITPQGIVGQVEIRQSAVGSPKKGVIAEVLVEMHQKVSAGDPIAVIEIASPAFLESYRSLVGAETELLKSNFAPIRPQQQMLIDYERLRLDALVLQAQVAVAKVQLAEAENELLRSKELAANKIISAAEFERFTALRDARKTQVTELTALVTESFNAAKEAMPIKEGMTPNSRAEAMAAAMTYQDKKLGYVDAEFGKIIIRAPADGYIGQIHRRKGDVVDTDLPVATINTASGNTVIGFARQPLREVPTVGMEVEVRARSKKRPSVIGKVRSVGSQLEAINPVLLPMSASDRKNPELALPFLVDIPKELHVLPGETVDIFLTPLKN